MTDTTMTKPAAEVEGEQKPLRHDRTVEQTTGSNVRSPRWSRVVRATAILIAGVALGAALSQAVINIDRTPAGPASSGPDPVAVRTSNSNSLPASADAIERWSTPGRSAASSNGWPMTADAAEHWAASQRQDVDRGRAADSSRLQAQADAYLAQQEGELEARHELCIGAPISVDSVERCMADR